MLILMFGNQDATVGPALSCLKNNISGTSNTYTLALLAYTFTLANDLETRQTLLDRLYLLGQSTGNVLEGVRLHFMYVCHLSRQGCMALEG